MLRQKDLTDLHLIMMKINTVKPSDVKNRNVIAKTIKHIRTLVKNTNNKSFLDIMENNNPFNNNDLIIKKSKKNSSWYVSYTDYGNTYLGFTSGAQVAHVINIIYQNGLDVYNSHRNYLLAHSTTNNTAYGHRNLLAFFVGNRYGCEARQAHANRYGTNNFCLYVQGGTHQAVADTNYINLVRQGMYDSVPTPTDLLDFHKVAKNIRLGQRLIKSERLQTGTTSPI